MSIIITTMAAANAIGTHTHVCSSSVIRKHNIYTHSTSFSQWSCLRQLSPSISQHTSYYLNLEKRRKIKRRGVYASLFGVGAPEALVIGVVALLVFGPKGLAEAARSLGSTLRAFQPTIRELQDVSREFKSTLEREIGLDEIQNPMQSNSTSSTNKANSSPSKSITPEDSQMKVDLSAVYSKVADGSPSTNNAYSSEDLLKITEEQLKAAAAEQEKQILTLAENRSEPQSQTQDIVQEIEAAGPPLPPQNPET